jgi:DNA-binding MarR family transcriptional regulator
MAIAEDSGPPPALAERLLFLLKRAQKVLTDAIEPGLSQLGLDVREFTVLVLLEAEGPRSQQRLSRRLGSIDRSTMVSLIDSLEAKGLAARGRDRADRRAYVIEITAAGVRALSRARPVVEAAEARVLAPLADEDAAALRRALQQLIAP